MEAGSSCPELPSKLEGFIKPGQLPPLSRRFAADLALCGVNPDTSWACLITAAETILGHTQSDHVKLHDSVIEVEEKGVQAAAAVDALELSGSVAFRVLYEAQHSVARGQSGQHEADVLTETMKLISAGLGSKPSSKPPALLPSSATWQLNSMQPPAEWRCTVEEAADTTPGLALRHAEHGHDALALIWRVPPSLGVENVKIDTICGTLPFANCSELQLKQRQLLDARAFAWNARTNTQATLSNIVHTQAVFDVSSSDVPSSQGFRFQAAGSAAPDQILQNSSGGIVRIAHRTICFQKTHPSAPAPSHAASFPQFRIVDLETADALHKAPGASKMRNALCTAIGKFTAVSSAICYLARGVLLSPFSSEVIDAANAAHTSKTARQPPRERIQAHYTVIAFIETVLKVMFSKSGADLADKLWLAVKDGKAWPILRTGLVRLFNLDPHLTLLLDTPLLSIDCFVELSAKVIHGTIKAPSIQQIQAPASEGAAVATVETVPADPPTQTEAAAADPLKQTEAAAADPPTQTEAAAADPLKQTEAAAADPLKQTKAAPADPALGTLHCGYDRSCPFNIAAINAALALLREGFPLVHRQYWANTNQAIAACSDIPLLRAMLGMQAHDVLLDYWHAKLLAKSEASTLPVQLYTKRRKMPTIWLTLGIARQVRLSKLLPCKGTILVVLPVSKWPDSVVQTLPAEASKLTGALSKQLAPLVGFWSNEVVEAVLQAAIPLVPHNDAEALPVISTELQVKQLVISGKRRMKKKNVSLATPPAKPAQDPNKTGQNLDQATSSLRQMMQIWVRHSSHAERGEDVLSTCKSPQQKCAALLEHWVRNSQTADRGLGQFSENVSIAFLGKGFDEQATVLHGNGTSSAAGHAQPNIQILFVGDAAEDSAHTEPACVFVVASQGRVLHSVRCICSAAPSEAQLRLVFPQLSSPSCAAELFIDEYPQVMKWLKAEEWGHIALAIGVAGLILEAHRSGGCLSSVLPRLQQTVERNFASMQNLLRDSIVETYSFVSMTLQEAELASWPTLQEALVAAKQPKPAAEPQSPQDKCTQASQELAECALRSTRRRCARRQWEEWCLGASALSPAAASSCSGPCSTPPPKNAEFGQQTTFAEAALYSPGAASSDSAVQPVTWSSLAPRPPHPLHALSTNTADGGESGLTGRTVNRKRFAPTSLDAALMHSAKLARGL